MFIPGEFKVLLACFVIAVEGNECFIGIDLLSGLFVERNYNK